MKELGDSIAARLLSINEDIEKVGQRLRESKKMKEQSLELVYSECESRGIVDVHSGSLPDDLRLREKEILDRHRKADDGLWKEMRDLEESKSEIKKLFGPSERWVVEEPDIPSVMLPDGGTVHVDTPEAQDRLLSILCQSTLTRGKNYAEMRNEVIGFLWQKLRPHVAERLEDEFKRQFSKDEKEFLAQLKRAKGLQFDSPKRSPVNNAGGKRKWQGSKKELAGEVKEAWYKEEQKTGGKRKFKDLKATAQCFFDQYSWDEGYTFEKFYENVRKH